MADSREMRAGMIEAEIDRFIVEGQYSLAVILSQTMLELLVEGEVRGLAEGLDTGSFGEATLELWGSFNLNRRTQRFFEHALDLSFNVVLFKDTPTIESDTRARNDVLLH